jgi:hypothetical protein
MFAQVITDGGVCLVRFDFDLSVWVHPEDYVAV